MWSQKVQRSKLLGGAIAANLEATLGERSLHTSYREYREDKHGREVAGSRWGAEYHMGLPRSCSCPRNVPRARKLKWTVSENKQ